MKILLVDNQEIIRKGIGALLEQSPGCQVVGEAADAFQALGLLKELQPDVLVIDIVNMPGQTGPDILAEIRERWPSLEIVVFTMAEIGDRAGAVLLSGARAMVLKSDTTLDLAHAVEAASLGKMYLSSAVAQLLVNQRASERPLSKLTEREVKVLRLLAEGGDSKEVAAVLGMSSTAVDAHRAKIVNKLALNSVSDLIRFTMRNRIASA